MELRHLRYFIAVAEELHFGRAARRLCISQPPLSQQIRQLEEELGVRLFQRTKRRVQMTDAGQALLPEARRTIAQSDRAVQVAQQVGRGESGRLSVGFVNAAIYSILPDILHAFRIRFPNVTVTLHELTTEEQIPQLLDRHIDLGLLRPPVREETLSSMIVLSEPFVVALPGTHPLAERSYVTLKAVADAPFLMATRHQGPALYDQTIALCQRAGFTPRVVQEADHMQTIVGLVAAGIGVALVPGSISNLKRAGVVYKPVHQPRALIDLVAAWRREDASKCLEAFLGVVKDVSSRAPAGGSRLQRQPGH